MIKIIMIMLMVCSIWVPGELIMTAQKVGGPVSAMPNAVVSIHDRNAFVRSQLEVAVKLIDRHFRYRATGQYLDEIGLGEEAKANGRSSIAATGVGLIALAIGDKLGILPEAAPEAEFTLRELIETDEAGAFHVQRSLGGWFHHWIDPATGVPATEELDAFSTIDTALLAAGTKIAGDYFEEKFVRTGDKTAARVSYLANRLIASVAWSQAVEGTNGDTIPTLLSFTGEGVPGAYQAHMFSEYALLPCIGRWFESSKGVSGPANRYWKSYLSKAEKLPTKLFGGEAVLSTFPDDYISHFAAQMPFYYCKALADDPIFQRELAELRDADRRWFRLVSDWVYPARWWGLGAGSTMILGSGAFPVEIYEATTLEPNGHHTFSPAIIAGFAPLDFLQLKGVYPFRSENAFAIDDLVSLWSHQECLYSVGEYRFLWRCSALSPDYKVQHLQAVDFSTYLLGLAELSPEIGRDFFKRYSF